MPPAILSRRDRRACRWRRRGREAPSRRPCQRSFADGATRGSRGHRLDGCTRRVPQSCAWCECPGCGHVVCRTGLDKSWWTLRVGACAWQVPDLRWHRSRGVAMRWCRQPSPAKVVKKGDVSGRIGGPVTELGSRDQCAWLHERLEGNTMRNRSHELRPTGDGELSLIVAYSTPSQ